MLPILNEASQKVYRALIDGRENARNKSIKLAIFPVLYKRVKDPQTLPAPHTLPDVPSWNADMIILNDALRNPLQHYSDDSLSIEVTGAPKIIRSACDIIEHLSLKHRTMFFHLDAGQPEAILESIGALRRNMKI